MHRGERLHQREAKAGAFLRAGMSPFHLFERLAEAFHVFRRDSHAGIADGDFHAVGAALGDNAHFAAARRELGAVGQKIHQHLLHRALVGEDGVHIRRDAQLQHHPFAVGLQLHETRRLIGDLGEIEHLFRQVEFSRLDLRHVQNAVYQLQQMAAALVDEARIFQIARAAHGSEHLVRHHFGETDDGVERRAQLMAHIGEEAGFGAVGLFRRIAGIDQGAFMRLAFGDIARHRDDVGRRAIHQRRRTAAYLGPKI